MWIKEKIVKVVSAVTYLVMIDGECKYFHVSDIRPSSLGDEEKQIKNSETSQKNFYYSSDTKKNLFQRNSS